MFKGNYGQFLGTKTSRRSALGAALGAALAATTVEAAPLAEARGFSDTPAVELTLPVPARTEMQLKLSAGQILLFQGPELQAAGNLYRPDNSNQGLTFVMVGMDTTDVKVGLSQGTYRMIVKQTISTGRDKFNDALQMGREWARGIVGENGFSQSGLTLNSKMVVLGAFANPEAPFQGFDPEIVGGQLREGLSSALQVGPWVPEDGKARTISLDTRDNSRIVAELWFPGGNPQFGDKLVFTVIPAGINAEVKAAGNGWKYNSDWEDSSVLSQASDHTERVRSQNPQKVHGLVPFSELVRLGIVQQR